MPRKKDPNQPDLFDVQDLLLTAPCVPLLRKRVDDWRNANYAGATDVTRQLLYWWFSNDHRLPNGQRFAYHQSQRVAIETLIYVYEVARVRTRKELLEAFARNSGEIRLPPADEAFARYCTKMATGSGKTKVMALAVVWQYMNAVMGGNDEEYARTFLIIAPNIIVLDRLKGDFADGHIFHADPLMPKEMKLFWDVDCVMRGDGMRASSDGLLLLTNIQQLHDRPEKPNGEVDAMTAVLGEKPRTATPHSESADFIERIRQRPGRLLVINDEAHHTHDEDLKWNEVIRNLHTVMPLVSQLDFSATPRFQSGQLFSWTISDYPLKQAIVDNIVKRPYKGIADIAEAPSEIASVRYRGYLVAAVQRWREYREQLSDVGKRPLLFIMLNNTNEADDVGNWLREAYPEDLGGDKTLVIHTKTNGDIKEGDVENARRLAREVDEPNCPVNAIVSVLMLREGWDVQNVTVVVGLRPYNAKANILPEQAIGRGLRLMFRGQGVDYRERVDIIGNSYFLNFIEELERIEDHKIESFDLAKDKLSILKIQPVAEKAQYDIGIPQLSPVLQRKRSLESEIEAIDVHAFRCPTLPKRPNDEAERKFHYEGYDFITLQKEIEREYTLPTPQTANEVIGYCSRLIADKVKLPAQFHALAPKVREFFTTVAFGEPVDIDEPSIIEAMSRPPAVYMVVKLFTDALRERLIETAEPQLITEARKLSECQPFPFSRVATALAAQKCIFNYAPCSNEFERAFGKFLDSAKDITSWCKLPESFRFSIEYTDQGANLRLYYPDFVAIADDGIHWIIETKGAETTEVIHKDEAAKIWCENATALTGTQWRYLKVSMKDFEGMQPVYFADITMVQ